MQRNELAFIAPELSLAAVECVAVRFCRGCQALICREVSPQEADGYRRSLLADYEPAFGRKLCADISPYGNQYIVQFTVDGNELPSATARLAWIDAKDGFHLSN